MSGWNGVAPGGGAMTGGGNDEWVEHKVGVRTFREIFDFEKFYKVYLESLIAM